MTHIEFLGPPGSGKTELYLNLIENFENIPFNVDEAIRKKWRDDSNGYHSHVIGLTPKLIQTYYCKAILKHRYRQEAISEFVVNNPGYLSLIDTVNASNPKEPELLTLYLLRRAGDYQIFDSTRSRLGVLCQDEGFIQLLASILWRIEIEGGFIDDYFNSVPEPDILISVECCPEICLERQHNRGSIAVDKQWGSEPLYEQYQWNNICRIIVETANRRTNVVQINNEESIEDGVFKLITELEQYDWLPAIYSHQQ